MNYNDNIFKEESLLNGDARQYLLQTVGWTKFLSIVGFIFTGLALITIIGLMGSGSALSYTMGYPMGGGVFAGMMIFYIVLILLYMYPIYCLYKFSTCIKAGLQSNNSSLVAEGFKYQKTMYMILGILMIILLSIYLLVFLFGGIAMLAAL
ncbi:MAG: hypothetical protein BGO09_16165 [Bacteroidetes bacterium 47-18]|nr:MAG: hypothetical protein BGO09_16165 [Bacteroidetes bacterium 47-18]